MHNLIKCLYRCRYITTSCWFDDIYCDWTASDIRRKLSGTFFVFSTGAWKVKIMISHEVQKHNARDKWRMTQTAWIRLGKGAELIKSVCKMVLDDLLFLLVEHMIYWYSLKQMGSLARRMNTGVVTMLAPYSSKATEAELKTTGWKWEEVIFDNLQLENSSGHECSSIGKLCSLR